MGASGGGGGRGGAHLIWGAPSSVLVGDYLFARALELMVEVGSLDILGVLSNASSTIAEGEVLQLVSQRDISTPESTYLEIIKAKTAELFAAAAEAGAVSAGASDDHCRAMRSYGLSLGLAFQLVDDALDYGGATETLGKNAGDDFREGKATLPLLLAIARTGAAEAAFWERTIGRREQTDEDFRRARDLIARTGAAEATLDLAHQFANEAKAALARMSDNPWRTALEDLADFAVSRRT